MEPFKILRRKLSRLAELRRFKKNFDVFRQMWLKSDSGLALEWDRKKICLQDNTAVTAFDRHYIYHTAWAARILSETKPALHTDISSSLYFSSIVSAFIKVKFYDIRPPVLSLDN